MNRTLIALAAFGMFAVGCEGTDPTTPMADGLGVEPQANTGPVVHRVSVGGADLCTGLGLKPGCDANYSVIAIQRADGSVKGQWQDTFGGGIPIHVTIDCLYVSGNQAWLSGVITGPVLPGLLVIIRVADNGTSANDPPDQISWSELDVYGGCTAAPDLPLVDMNEGQVKVW